MTDLLTIRNVLIAYLTVGAIVCLVHPRITRAIIADFMRANIGVGDVILGMIGVLIIFVVACIIWPLAWFNVEKSKRKSQEALADGIADWLRKRKSLREEKARQKREGLRKRQDYDIVVGASKWKPEFNRLLTTWIEGEIRELLPGDIVLKFGWQLGPLCGRGGYAIERNGRIVADHTEWIS